VIIVFCGIFFQDSGFDREIPFPFADLLESWSRLMNFFNSFTFESTGLLNRIQNNFFGWNAFFRSRVPLINRWVSAESTLENLNVKNEIQVAETANGTTGRTV
jgi:AAA+ ATPase superfamily predicted ATPase